MEIFDSGEMQIISGQGEAVKNIYDVYRGKSGFLWLVANNIKNKADAIYMQGRKGSDGFAGATLKFDISHGDSISLSGAWKAGAGDLFKDTGIDVGNCHSGFVVVGLRRGKPPANCYYRTIIEDVIYKDQGEVIGEPAWVRADKIAKELANARGEPVFYFASSPSSNSSCQVKPDVVAQP